MYSDKNLFPIIVGDNNTPKTLICRINSSQLLDNCFQLLKGKFDDYLKDVDEVVLKPTINSCSGLGVKKFTREGDVFLAVGNGKEILSKDYLLNYGGDFCLQEAVKQHEVMRRLCRTAVNTMRLCVYRSPIDETPRVTASILRVGRDGSIVDNGHAGGKFTSINLKTGELGKYVIDQYGNKSESWNGINYSKETFRIPHWEKVVAFAEMVGQKIIHHRMLALDIALTKELEPILIEYNIDQFSYWLFQYSGQTVFGGYTDEVIDYCSKFRV